MKIFKESKKIPGLTIEQGLELSCLALCVSIVQSCELLLIFSNYILLLEML